MKAFIVTLKHVTIADLEGVSERKLPTEETMRPGFRYSRYLKYCKEYFNEKGWKQKFKTSSHLLSKLHVCTPAHLKTIKHTKCDKSF